MPTYYVLIDIDAQGGDDDVFTVRARVEAETPEEAMRLGEAKAVVVYGTNVLGAFDARPAENQKAT